MTAVVDFWLEDSLSRLPSPLALHICTLTVKFKKVLVNKAWRHGWLRLAQLIFKKKY